MRLVTDASVAVKWLAEEEDSVAANRLLGAGHELYVPRLIASEIGNALWRKARSGELAPQMAESLAARIANMLLIWADDAELTADALRFALSLNHPIYDCVYLALAYRIGGTVITADTRFANAVASTEHRSRVTLLADFTPE